MLPNDMQMKGLRRNDDAMKNECRYYHLFIGNVSVTIAFVKIAMAYFWNPLLKHIKLSNEIIFEEIDCHIINYKHCRMY